MTTQAEGSLNYPARASSRTKALTAAYGCTVLFTGVIGTLGLSRGSWLRQMLESWINVHVLFGLLLCGLVVARHQWQSTRSPRMRPADIRALSRHLSRMVYLLLYAVVGLRLTMGIFDSLWHGHAVDFKLFDGSSHGPDQAGFDPKDDFESFLASGLLALTVIRVLAYRLRSGLEDHSAEGIP